MLRLRKRIQGSSRTKGVSILGQGTVWGRRNKKKISPGTLSTLTLSFSDHFFFFFKRRNLLCFHLQMCWPYFCCCAHVLASLMPTARFFFQDLWNSKLFWFSLRIQEGEKRESKKKLLLPSEKIHYATRTQIEHREGEIFSFLPFNDFRTEGREGAKKKIFIKCM